VGAGGSTWAPEFNDAVVDVLSRIVQSGEVEGGGSGDVGSEGAALVCASSLWGGRLGSALLRGAATGSAFSLGLLLTDAPAAARVAAAVRRAVGDGATTTAVGTVGAGLPPLHVSVCEQRLAPEVHLALSTGQAAAAGVCGGSSSTNCDANSRTPTTSVLHHRGQGEGIGGDNSSGRSPAASCQRCYAARVVPGAAAPHFVLGFVCSTLLGLPTASSPGKQQPAAAARHVMHVRGSWLCDGDVSAAHPSA
jgi:hypothetical protein